MQNQHHDGDETMGPPSRPGGGAVTTVASNAGPVPRKTKKNKKRKSESGGKGGGGDEGGVVVKVKREKDPSASSSAAGKHGKEHNKDQAATAAQQQSLASDRAHASSGAAAGSNASDAHHNRDPDKPPRKKQRTQQQAQQSAPAASASSSSRKSSIGGSGGVGGSGKAEVKVEGKAVSATSGSKASRKSSGGSAGVSASGASHTTHSTAGATGASAGAVTSSSNANDPSAALSEAQKAVNDQMRRALEEDQYSANGSIVDTESDDEDQYLYRGIPVRLDRAAIQQAVKKHALLERLGLGPSGMSSASSSNINSSSLGAVGDPTGDGGMAGGEYEEEDDKHRRKKSKKKKKKNKEDHHYHDRLTSGNDLLHDASMLGAPGVASGVPGSAGGNAVHPSGGGLASDGTGTGSGGNAGNSNSLLLMGISGTAEDEDLDRDGGSIFGQTAGCNNSTWVECDKCKKWRRLRGVVDEKKLPSKWFCSMNKGDPERARCSAPEEEYEASHTPESAADARTRKHLRVWVRRLQCNEAYETRQPTLTRGKKRAFNASAKDPYEWVRCCNPSCGKWRAVLKVMDAKSAVMDRAVDKEWYCVMNTWDEKMASCAAPQENLPAIGCPLWVHQDKEETEGAAAIGSSGNNTNTKDAMEEEVDGSAVAAAVPSTENVTALPGETSGVAVHHPKKPPKKWASME